MNEAQMLATDVARRAGRMGDNPCIKIHNKGQEILGVAIGLAVGADGRATHYQMAKKSITLYWHEEKDAKELPYKMGPAALTDFVWHWLQGVERGPQPDHDGSNTESWMLDTGDGWGHVDGSFYSMFRVTATWAMHGK
jgi:hypothetical protein